MSDRVQINALERSSSGDINDLESMATRVVAELQKFTQASKFEGPLAIDIPRSFTGGLTLISDGGNNALLTPGFLAQLSLTQPAPPGPLDSDLRLGFNKANLPVTLPLPPGVEIDMLEARVIDVVTVSAVRDVFDVPTQTFIPTLLDKQIERQVETQFISGTATNSPQPTGNPWVVMYTLVLAGPTPAPLNLLFLSDLRPQVNDGEQSNAVGAFFGDGELIRGNLATFNNDDEPRTDELVGHVEGRVLGRHLMFKATPVLAGVSPFLEVGFSGPPNTLVHLYICPIFDGLLGFAPRSTFFPDPTSRLRGVPVVSENPPTAMALTNFSAITLPAPFANFNAGVVPAGSAFYAGSFATDGSGIAWESFTAAEDGTVFQEFFSATSPFRVVSVVGAIGAGGDTIPFDLRGIVPDNAKAVLLRVNNNDGGSTISGIYQFREAGGAGLILDGYTGLILGLGAGAQVKQQFLLPVGGHKNDNGQLNMDILRTVSGPGGQWTFTVEVKGWKT